MTNLDPCKLCGCKPNRHFGIKEVYYFCATSNCRLRDLTLKPAEWSKLMTPPQLVSTPRTAEEASEFIRIVQDRLAEIENEHKIIENGLRQ